MHLLCIPPDKVGQVWHGVRHFIQQAVDRADLICFAPVEASVLDGSALLWVAFDPPEVRGAAVTQITPTDRRNVLQITAAGGSLAAAHELLPEMEEYARGAGCGSVRIIGRLGWQKVLPGYECKSIILEKAL